MRRRCTIVLATALAAAPAAAQTVKTILNNGPVGNRYDIVILGDGYQDFEEGKFDNDARQAVNRLFASVAWGTYQLYFNAHTVFRASAESGADDPTASPPVFVNTAYDATYNYGGTQRCLYIQNTSRALADSRLAPDVEGRVIVLVNDTQYGGCAGTFSVSYTGSSGPEVQAHEFGHSFGLLADEYDYGRSGTYSGPEPGQANITAESTGSLKWPLWLGFQGVSAFEGAGYYARGLWRPKSNCLMRNLGVALCPVCNEQIVKQAYVTVDPIENPQPPSTSVTLQRPGSQVFSFQNLVPGNHSITWSVDGMPVASGSTSFSWSSLGAATGRHTVTATVVDLTTFVRSDPGGLLTSRRTWNVDVVSQQPGSYTLFGAACPGSVPAPSACVAVNPFTAPAGLAAQAGASYALEVLAPSALSVTGFELQSNSRQAGSVSVPIALYAEAAGRPGAQLATGTVRIGPTNGWYLGSFGSTVSVQAGQRFYVAFTVPQPTPITAPIVSGLPTPYFIDTGAGWNGPIVLYPWTFRVHCSPTTLAPRLTATGVPEIATSFGVNLDQALPNTSAVLLFGASNTTWGGFPLPIDLGGAGAPGCQILASGEIVLPLAVGGGGNVSVTLPVPNVGALVSAVFHNQFYVLDAQANQLGTAWTNGGTAVIGQ